MTARSTARHAFARAMGVAEGSGSSCVCCGDSPFDMASPWRKALGAGFSDWDCFERPAAEALCAGCARLLGGRPGDDPPPPRTRTLAVVDHRLVLPAIDEVWRYLTDPPAALLVLSWAVSKQKHHPLYAEPCTVDVLRIGSDSRTIDVRPARDGELMQAVLELRAADDKGKPWFSRDEILSGHYSTPKIAIRGAQRWADLESIVAPRRGDPALDVIVAHAPVLPPSPTTTEDSMLDTTDERAVALLHEISRSSTARQADGLGFWSSLFLRRLQRHAGRPLAAFASRMLADLSVEPHSPGAQSVAAQVTTITDDDAAALMARLRERGSLLIALAYDRHKTEAAKRKKPASTPVPDFPEEMFE